MAGPGSVRQHATVAPSGRSPPRHGNTAVYKSTADYRTEATPLIASTSAAAYNTMGNEQEHYSNELASNAPNGHRGFNPAADDDKSSNLGASHPIVSEESLPGRRQIGFWSAVFIIFNRMLGTG